MPVGRSAERIASWRRAAPRLLPPLRWDGRRADDAEAGERLRFHVLDVVDRVVMPRSRADGDDFGHFLRRDAGVGPDHADHRDVDFGKYVGGHADDRDDAQQ